MLTVAKVTGSHAAGYADYLEGKTAASEAGDYYLKDGERVEAPGRWVGGAQAVGVDPGARVAGEQLRMLMDVRRPDTGRSLRPAGSTGEAVAALDATFSAPKSVSAVWALADPGLRARVEAAHETAIDRALHYATAQVPMVRERLDKRTVIHAKARGLIATSWRHTTARVVDGPPDPQLHSHVLLHAAVRRDGQIAAIDSRTWLTHRRELGAAYRTELAHELNRLGFPIQRGTGRGGRYFEINGIPQALLDRWSSRSHQVQEAIQAHLEHKRTELQNEIDAGGETADDARARLRQLDEHGVSAGENRFLAQTSRAGKQPATRDDLDTAWQTTARDHGLLSSDVTRLSRLGRRLTTPDLPGLEARLTELDATLSRSHVRAIAFEHASGLPIRNALLPLGELRDGDRLLTLADETLTTATHRDRERVTVDIARRLAAGDVDAIAPAVIQQHADRLDLELRAHGGRLSTEQRSALQLACGEGQLTVIQGQAGTGKSTVLVGIARAHEQSGQQIVVTSTAALAAQRLADELDSAGVSPVAYSTVALQHAITNQTLVLDPATTILHDEAALASTHELHALLEVVEDSGARVVLIGDPRQSQPVGAGGLWPHIEHAAKLQDADATLTRNLRAHDPLDARDQARFRDDEPGVAIQGYADRDRLHFTARQPDAEDIALEAAHADRLAGQQTIVIAQTSNDHLDELNARAQAIRQQNHELGDESLPLTGRPYQLHTGDEIQLRASISHEGATLRNGTTATIISIDQHANAADLDLGDGRQVSLQRSELDDAHARLAYVQHPFPAQGTTTDTAHLIVAEHATREGTYVALTRAREQTHLYAATDKFDSDHAAVPQVAERVSRTEPELPSISQPLAHERAITQQLNESSQRVVAAKERQLDRASEPAADEIDRPNAISAYRQKYGIAGDDPRPLGPEPPADAFRQRRERRDAAHQALATLDATDRPRDRALVSELQQLDDTTHQHDPNDGLNRTF